MKPEHLDTKELGEIFGVSLFALNSFSKMQAHPVFIAADRNLSSEFYNVYWLSQAPWWVMWSANDFQYFLRQ